MISYIQVENLKKSFGDLVLFENLNIGISKNQKIALIAKNGTGKTTLLNIISGLDTPDTGNITFRRDIRLGFLQQNPSLNENNTVFEEIYSSSNSIIDTVKAYNRAIESENKADLQKAMEEMDRLNAWDYEVKIKQILTRLKIDKLNQKIATLSGGEKKRVALANILIDQPDVLILDEPTNHLDVDMIEWLEIYLKTTKVTLFMVTHDRYFLDRVCNEIIEMDQSQIFQYNGNYSYFLKKRAERIHALELEVGHAKNLLRKAVEWMRRMPKARGTKAKYRKDSYYNLKDVASQKRNENKLEINVQGHRLGKKIIDIEKLEKSFDDLNILKDFSYKFEKNEKIGIVGKNGAGKSTFLNLITDKIKPDSGSIEIGETVVFGYYTQQGIKFDNDQRIIDIATEIADVVALGDGREMSVKEFLNYFLFPYDMHYNRVEKLSGGEKRRLYLMTVLMKKPNFLILDEPTNDLDIMTLGVLEDYLSSFGGCVIIVSHDRFFMDQVVDHLFVFKGKGVVKDFPGNYSQYRESIVQHEKEKNTKVTKPKKEKPKNIEQTKTKLSYKEKREYELLEKEIEELESEKSALEKEISSGELKSDDLIEKSDRIGEIIKLLDSKSDRWLELGEFV
ncbi:MAG: ABC-F family ATP-binding cassette domain-containing protein [Bacteroidales bacterium]|jgi:ATP-binding cassette subfamily F protein uup|nr:ABC-F family ATP-binding cassette domain-containing protein [Bacteroidales bacterium]